MIGVGRLISPLAIVLVMLLFGLVVMIGGGDVASAQPPVGGCVVTPPRAPGGPTGPQETATLSAAQMAVARTIVGVGKGMSVVERGTAIALGTAMQESRLDPSVSNGRSVGLFQQQGELYASVHRTDAADASRAFFQQLLARVPRYGDPGAVSFADAAQEVQRSGAGASFYAKWETWAVALSKQLFSGAPAQGGDPGGVTCAPGGGSGPIGVVRNGVKVDLPPQAGIKGILSFPNEKAAIAAAAALSYVGTTYAWGGGNQNGPTKGQSDHSGAGDAHGDYNKIGFDCSGLMVYAFAGAGVYLPHYSGYQYYAGAHIPLSQMAPGDMLFYGNPSNIHHVTMYVGGGQMIEAPYSGSVVRVVPVRWGEIMPYATRVL